MRHGITTCPATSPFTTHADVTLEHWTYDTAAAWVPRARVTVRPYAHTMTHGPFSGHTTADYTFSTLLHTGQRPVWLYIVDTPDRRWVVPLYTVVYLPRTVTMPLPPPFLITATTVFCLFRTALPTRTCILPTPYLYLYGFTIRTRTFLQHETLCNQWVLYLHVTV